VRGERDDDWVTAAELAEFAYCPRAHWYSVHRPDTPAPRSSARRQSAGEAYHAREGRAIVHRRARSGGYWALLLGAVLLLLLVVALAGWR
jgi:CRISPR/Cas system-associated exonuclease Cas4 (RecB family)